MYAPKETQQALMSAVNLICEHVKQNLPADWEISLVMSASECEMRLFDAEGMPVDWVPENGISAIDEACVLAQEVESR